MNGSGALPKLTVAVISAAALVGIEGVVANRVGQAQPAGASRGSEHSGHGHDQSEEDRIAEERQRVLALSRMVMPPTGWVMDEKASLDLAEQLGNGEHFGGLRSMTSAEVWASAAHPTQKLVVTRVVTSLAQGDKLGSALSKARAEFAAAAGGSSGAKVDLVAKESALSGTLHRPDAGQSALLLLGQSETLLEAVTVTCEWDPAVSKGEPCMAQLATASTTIPPTKRRALTLQQVQDSAAAGPSGPERLTAPAMGEQSPQLRTTLTGGDATIKIPPIALEQPQPSRDWRPFIVGAGLVIIALAFWLNRRHRANLEQLDGRPVRKKV